MGVTLGPHTVMIDGLTGKLSRQGLLLLQAYSDITLLFDAQNKLALASIPLLTADKVQIGQRNVILEGIEFEHNDPSTNQVSWSSGTIRYINDSNVVSSASITGSNATWSSGVLYVYWVQGGTTLSSTTTAATAFADGNAVLAVYKGGTDLVVNYGRTIIDGSGIKTNSITATQIAAGTITATQIASSTITATQIASNAVTTDKLNANAVTAAKIAANTITVNEITVNGLTGDVSTTAQSGSSTTTTSTSFVDLDSMSLSVTAAANEKIRIDFNAAAINVHATAGEAQFRIVRDGTQLSNTINARVGAHATDYQSTSLVAIDTPGAGTFTYKIQWKVTANSGECIERVMNRTRFKA